MNTDNMIISEAADRLVQAGFNGFNGCGSGMTSKLACKLLLLPLTTDIIKELEVCWYIHDAEYTVSTSVKSIKHKIFADEALSDNMLSILNKYNKTSKIPLLIISAIHTALIVGGDDAYWQKKSKTSSSWIFKLGVSVGALYIFIKSLL